MVRVPLPSRRRVSPAGYELVPEGPARRGHATINIRHEDKEVFDALQWYLAHRRGRRLSQWDVFSRVLAAALANAEDEVGRAELSFSG